MTPRETRLAAESADVIRQHLVALGPRLYHAWQTEVCFEFGFSVYADLAWEGDNFCEKVQDLRKYIYTKILQSSILHK